MGYSKSEILRNKDNMREEAGRPRALIKSLVIITGILESSNPFAPKRRRILFS